MAGLKGLESLGFGNLDGLEIFEEEKKKEDGGSGKEGRAVEKDYELEALFDKGMECPCCYNEFKVKTIRTGKIKASEHDSDLRPRYEKVDPLKYDAIVCPKCGYASITRFFSLLSDGQRKLIRENITPSFKGINTDIAKYSYDDAILRHKLALFNTVVKKGKDGDKSYICLKLAWLYRGKAEEMEADGEDEAAVQEIRKEEMSNIKLAYDGFNKAYTKETFPVCGMDQPTMMYLLAELARRLGMKDEAGRWVSRLVGLPGVSRRIKDMVYELREKMK